MHYENYQPYEPPTFWCEGCEKRVSMDIFESGNHCKSCVKSIKITASALVAQKFFNAQGAWGREASSILINAGYKRDAVNKALAEMYDENIDRVNKFSKVVREDGGIKSYFEK